jgi:molybdate/tungstate transport system substrate-binding protein
MLKNAPNREAAEAFLAYLLAPEGGQKILRQYGQPPFDPSFVPTREMYQKLPKGIQDLVSVKQ